MSFYTLLTAIGAADFINAQAGGTTVPFTHLALGDGNGAAVTPLESMTALVCASSSQYQRLEVVVWRPLPVAWLTAPTR